MWAIRRWPTLDHVLDHGARRIAIVGLEDRQRADARNVVGDERDRHAVVQFGKVLARQPAGEEEDAVDLAGAHQPVVVRFALGVAAGVAEEDAVAGLGDQLLDRVDDHRVEGVAEPGQERQHHLRRLGAEIAGERVRRIADRRDRRLDRAPRLLGDALGRGERAAHRRRRDAGALATSRMVTARPRPASAALAPWACSAFLPAARAATCRAMPRCDKQSLTSVAGNVIDYTSGWKVRIWKRPLLHCRGASAPLEREGME